MNSVNNVSNNYDYMREITFVIVPRGPQLHGGDLFVCLVESFAFVWAPAILLVL